MAWIAALVAAAYGGYQQHTQNRKARQANQRNAELFSNKEPNYIERALSGYAGGNQYQKDLTAIAQGTYLSPNVLSKPLAAINRGVDTNMQRTAATIGRSNMSGGLANAYALANQAGGQEARAGLVQNYGIWRDKQRRADLDWLQGQRNTELNRRQGNAIEIANRYQNTAPSWMAGVGAGWGTWAGSEGPGSFGDVIAGNGWTGKGQAPVDWKLPQSDVQTGRRPANNPYGPPPRSGYGWE